MPLIPITICYYLPQILTLSGPVNQTVSEGNPVTLHCQFKAKSGDKARVSWLKEGIPIEFADNDRYYLTEGYNLQIKGEIIHTTHLLCQHKIRPECPPNKHFNLALL